MHLYFKTLRHILDLYTVLYYVKVSLKPVKLPLQCAPLLVSTQSYVPLRIRVQDQK
jgi:hypothetical protein